jgi:hypothetical protein
MLLARPDNRLICIKPQQIGPQNRSTWCEAPLQISDGEKERKPWRNLFSPPTRLVTALEEAPPSGAAGCANPGAEYQNKFSPASQIKITMAVVLVCSVHASAQSNIYRNDVTACGLFHFEATRSVDQLSSWTTAKDTEQQFQLTDNDPTTKKLSDRCLLMAGRCVS